MATETTTDESIRQYLTLIHDADSLVDNKLVDDLQRQLENEEDPIERIKLRSRIEKATHVPVEEIELGFITHVKDWIGDNEVTVSSLLSEGVTVEVLASAGVELNGHAPEATKKKATKKATAKKATAKKAESEETTEPVRAEDVTKFLRRTRKPFTIPHVMESTGASRATVKKAMDELINEGVIEPTGEEESSSRGRAAVLFARIG